jgi:acetoacetyl-CoA synthetase
LETIGAASYAAAKKEGKIVKLEKIDTIVDSLAVGINSNGDEKVILFVKLEEEKTLLPELENMICNTLKKQASPRHVPYKIFQVYEFQIVNK